MSYTFAKLEVVMDHDKYKQEVWRPKPRDEKRNIIPEKKPESIVFSPELLVLKKIMDDKIKCQHYRDHKLVEGTWVIDRAMKSYHISETYHKPEWEECQTCNK
jgi:hypothetical protein